MWYENRSKSLCFHYGPANGSDFNVFFFISSNSKLYKDFGIYFKINEIAAQNGIEPFCDII